MRNFQDSFETRKRAFISAFSICMTVPLIKRQVELIFISVKRDKFPHIISLLVKDQYRKESKNIDRYVLCRNISVMSA